MHVYVPLKQCRQLVGPLIIFQHQHSSASKFETNGYVVFYAAVHEDVINTWRSLSRNPLNVWFTAGLLDINEEDPIGDEWFVDDERLIEDDGRFQAVVLDQDGRNMSRSLKRFYRAFFRNARANDWRLMKKLAGTADLSARRVFSSVSIGADIIDVSAMPGSIVVATDDDMCFYTYGWNSKVALRSNRRRSN
ncbi:hypothetical protein PHYPSEUDO_001849 [Phytophthora pseudosyringae]|uniref:Uncharacterized protein n=1 Tax=Phytophthora pseudosyringae TaxID=221518 RepID=A0A8T1VW36_9STRA|nr:hypothetical protein PHYPSEUDO_001849 [Phytophthora pseudosyringae]